MTQALASRIRRRVAEDLAGVDGEALRGADRKEFARRQAFRHLDALTAGEDTGETPPLTPEDEEDLARTVLDALFGLGRLQALVDDPCRTKQRLGCDLMRPTKKLFALWKRFRDGTITRGTFERRLKPIRQEIEERLMIEP